MSTAETIRADIDLGQLQEARAEGHLSFSHPHLHRTKKSLSNLMGHVHVSRQSRYEGVIEEITMHALYVSWNKSLLTSHAQANLKKYVAASPEASDKGPPERNRPNVKKYLPSFD